MTTRFPRAMRLPRLLITLPPPTQRQALLLLLLPPTLHDDTAGEGADPKITAVTGPTLLVTAVAAAVLTTARF